MKRGDYTCTKNVAALFFVSDILLVQLRQVREFAVADEMLARWFPTRSCPIFHSPWHIHMHMFSYTSEFVVLTFWCENRGAALCVKMFEKKLDIEVGQHTLPTAFLAGIASIESVLSGIQPWELCCLDLKMFKTVAEDDKYEKIESMNNNTNASSRVAPKRLSPAPVRKGDEKRQLNTHFNTHTLAHTQKHT